MSPGVSRSRMSRGTTRRIALGRRTRTLPNSSRSVTRARPSGPPSNPPLRLRSTSAIAPGGGGSAIRATIPTGWPASPSSSASRGAWSLTRTTRAFSPSQCSTPSTSRSVRPGGRTGSRQPNRSPEVRLFEAYAMPCASTGLGLPGELQRPRAVEARLPVARRAGTTVGQSLRQLALLHELGVPLLGLAPQERRRRRRGRRARRGRTACPASRWSRPVDGATSRAQTSAASPAASARPAVGVAVRALRVARRRRTARGPARAAPAACDASRPSRRPDLVGAAGRQQELGRGQQGRGRAPSRRTAGRWGRRRGGCRSRRRRTRSGSAGRRSAGTRRRCRRGARTRPAPRPRGPARSHGRAARRGARPSRSASRP